MAHDNIFHWIPAIFTTIPTAAHLKGWQSKNSNIDIMDGILSGRLHSYRSDLAIAQPMDLSGAQNYSLAPSRSFSGISDSRWVMVYIPHRTLFRIQHESPYSCSLTEYILYSVPLRLFSPLMGNIDGFVVGTPLWEHRYFSHHTGFWTSVIRERTIEIAHPPTSTRLVHTPMPTLQLADCIRKTDANLRIKQVKYLACSKYIVLFLRGGLKGE